jgi:VWFA-related protein
VRLLILAVLLAAQVTAGDARPPVASVAVSVVNRSGNERVRGLKAADFRVFEDRVEQPVAFISEGPGPVSVAVVLDTSDGMAGLGLELAEGSVHHLVTRLAPDDQIALVTYERGITVAVPWTDAAKFPKLEWDRWKTMPFSEVLQGIYQALGMMNEAKHSRAAVLLISDAEQVGSKYSLRDFVRSRRESEAGIYGLRTADLLSGSADIGGPRPGAPHSTTTIWESRGALISFDDLVRDSGGLVLPARTTTEAERSVSTLISTLRDQYVLTFTSKKPPDDTYRRLKVELRKGGPKLRYATGYLAKP